MLLLARTAGTWYAHSSLTWDGGFLESLSAMQREQTYDVIVAGAGNAGCEAELAEVR